jgi:predicted NBD/HSP70 family sugar kinase
VALGPDDDVVAASRVATDSTGPQGILDSVRHALVQLSDGRPPDEIAAIGVGVPGLVDVDHGVVSHAVNLGIGDRPFPIARSLTDDLGVPVFVENDVNAASLGAAWRLAEDQAVDDLAYLSLGTGVAAGIVLNGELHRGRRGAAGEIGHFPVAPEGPRCECGLVGCLEVVLSGSALARNWPTGPDTSSTEALFEAADRGDPAAIEYRDRYAGYLAHAVHLIAVTYDVDLIVLGGGVAQVGEPLEKAAGLALSQLAAQSPFVDALDLEGRLRLTPTGPIGAIGAGVAAIHRFDPAREARRYQRA